MYSCNVAPKIIYRPDRPVSCPYITSETQTQSAMPSRWQEVLRVYALHNIHIHVHIAVYIIQV